MQERLPRPLVTKSNAVCKPLRAAPGTDSVGQAIKGVRTEVPPVRYQTVIRVQGAKQMWVFLSQWGQVTENKFVNQAGNDGVSFEGACRIAE